MNCQPFTIGIVSPISESNIKLFDVKFQSTNDQQKKKILILLNCFQEQNSFRNNNFGVDLPRIYAKQISSRFYYR